MPTALVCPRCRQPARPGMAFCGNCGYSLAATAMPPMSAAPMRGAAPYAAPVAPRRSSCGKVLLVGLLAFVVLGVAVGIGSWFFISRALAYTPPVRRAPKLPPQTAASFKELPLDTDANAPTQPGSVMTQNFPTGAGTSASPKVPQTWLPPGLDRASLPRRASTLTSVSYRPRAAATSGSRDAIYIHVLVPPANQTANAAEMTTAITQAMRGEKSAVRFQNGKGEVYAGSRIRAQEKTVYVLEKQNSNTVVIIYAPAQGMQAAAERLAAALGNGEGLNDYPGTQTSLWTLPAEPPGEFTLQEVNTLAGDELGISGEEIMSGGDAETRETLAQIRGLIPERLTVARYQDRTRREWNAMVFDYGSAGRAWRNWLLIRWTVGVASMESVPVLGGQGLHAENDGQRILITQKGPYLIILAGPGAASLESLVGLANTFQI